MESGILTPRGRPPRRPWRAALLCGLICAVSAARAPALSFQDPGAITALAARLANAMTDEELLGQVFFLGWQGAGPSKDILRWISDRGIGGVKIFPRNVSSLPSLARDIAAMQKLASRNRLAIPLFVATDQEGGWVRQIKDETSVSPGNLALGATGAPGDSYLTGWYLGRELAALGITMDFAPTADVYLNPKASVIGPRSFGSDPSTAGLLSAAYARGMRNAGVLCVAKHFPGHGSADKDSHGHLPRIDTDLDQLLKQDLIPYRILIREGIPAIMSGHLAFPRILGSNTPASLSSFFLRGILRDRLGFKGLVITDDMEMEGALDDGKGTPSACKRALEAGNDMVLISHTPPTQEKTWRSLITLVRSNKAFKAILRESAGRILETKLRYYRGLQGDAAAQAAAAGSASVRAARSATAVPSVAALSAAAIHAQIPAPGAQAFFARVSARAVTLVSGKRIPYRPGARERILLCGQFPEFISEGRRRFPAADTFTFPLEPFYSARPEDMAAMRARAGFYDTIIFCLANYNSLDVMQKLKPVKAKVICISTLSPVYLTEAAWLETAIAVYGTGRDSFRAGFNVLAGDYAAMGVLPIRFPNGADR